MNILAIDPGASGGIAARVGLHTRCWKMPETPKDLCDIIAQVNTDSLAHTFDGRGDNMMPPTLKCYLEEVGGYVGGEGQPGSAMFRFGEGYGIIQGILIALGIPYELVRPQKWQKIFSIGSAGLIRGNYAGMPPLQAQEEKRKISALNARAKTAHKNKLKETAQRLFPSCKVTLATCDALLLMEYGLRQSIGRMDAPSLTKAADAAPLTQAEWIQQGLLENPQ